MNKYRSSIVQSNHKINNDNKYHLRLRFSQKIDFTKTKIFWKLDPTKEPKVRVYKKLKRITISIHAIETTTQYLLLSMNNIKIPKSISESSLKKMSAKFIINIKQINGKSKRVEQEAQLIDLPVEYSFYHDL